MPVLAGCFEAVLGDIGERKRSRSGGRFRGDLSRYLTRKSVVVAELINMVAWSTANRLNHHYDGRCQRHKERRDGRCNCPEEPTLN